MSSFFFLSLEIRKKEHPSICKNSYVGMLVVCILHMFYVNNNFRKIILQISDIKSANAASFIIGGVVLVLIFNFYLQNREKSQFNYFVIMCCLLAYILINNTNILTTFLFVELLSVSFVYLLFYKKSYKLLKSEVNSSTHVMLIINFAFSCIYILVYLTLLKKFSCFSFSGQFFYLNKSELSTLPVYLNLIVIIIFFKSASPIALKYKFELYDNISISSLCAYVIYSVVFIIYLIFQMTQQSLAFISNFKILFVVVFSIIFNYKLGSGLKEIMIVSTSIITASSLVLM